MHVHVCDRPIASWYDGTCFRTTIPRLNQLNPGILSGVQLIIIENTSSLIRHQCSLHYVAKYRYLCAT